MADADYKKERIAADFAELLPILRKKLNITQQELGDKVGVTRQTILFAESQKRPLTWTMFLALAFLFMMDYKTRSFLLESGIMNDELSQILLGDKTSLMKTTAMSDMNTSMLSKSKLMISSLTDNDEK